MKITRKVKFEREKKKSLTWVQPAYLQEERLSISKARLMFQIFLNAMKIL